MNLAYESNFCSSVEMLLIPFVPGHAWILHFFDSERDPGHSFPPLDGLGLLQARALVWRPVPHVLVQEEYFPHLPHLPFTTYHRKYEISESHCVRIKFFLQTYNIINTIHTWTCLNVTFLWIWWRSRALFTSSRWRRIIACTSSCLSSGSTLLSTSRIFSPFTPFAIYYKS